MMFELRCGHCVVEDGGVARFVGLDCVVERMVCGQNELEERRGPVVLEGLTRYKRHFQLWDVHVVELVE